jgi:hypothetical protein
MASSRRPRARHLTLVGRPERQDEWSDAHVTFDRIADVSRRCPNCNGLVNRRLGPGVLCGTCGRLWIVREMLEREAARGLEAAS